MFVAVLTIIQNVQICNFSSQHYSNLSDNDRTHLQNLLHTLIKKFKYDEDYNFLNQVNFITKFVESEVKYLGFYGHHNIYKHEYVHSSLPNWLLPSFAALLIHMHPYMWYIIPTII